MDGLLAIQLVVGTSNALPIYGYDLTLGSLKDCLNPGSEAALKLTRIETSEDPTKRVMRWNPVL
jgi:hypothetical protein